MSITLGVSTLAFCENSQDTIFREGLAAAATYALDGGDLVINLANDGGAMRFRNGGAAEGMAEPPATGNLTGTTWEWVKTVTPMEEIAATDQTRYNIVFNEDGSVDHLGQATKDVTRRRLTPEKRGLCPAAMLVVSDNDTVKGKGKMTP